VHVLFYFTKRACTFFAVECAPDGFAARLFKASYLLYGRRRVRRIRVCHRLYQYAMAVTDGDAANAHAFGLSLHISR
jgi:hypothetical protein